MIGESFTPAQWPSNVKILFTSRAGGVSTSPYGQLNLALHVGDNPEAVAENRKKMLRALGPRVSGAWLNQIHGNVVWPASACLGNRAPDGDALWTDCAGTACVVMVADCLPILLCDSEGRQVAAVHAGWRGLAGGVVEAALRSFVCPADEVLAWLGPAIGPNHFDVGTDVYKAFVDPGGELAAKRFVSIPQRKGFYRADLQGLAQDRLRALGVTNVGAERYCTYSNAELFFSYRREKVTGRNAAAIVRL